MRKRLPNRRPAETVAVEHADFSGTVTIGVDPTTGRAAEIFVSMAKPDSPVQRLADDAAIVASIALQSGVRIVDLRRSLSRTPRRDGSLAPASIIGVALAVAQTIENGADGRLDQ